jgi:hypothetical protein
LCQDDVGLQAGQLLRERSYPTGVSAEQPKFHPHARPVLAQLHFGNEGCGITAKQIEVETAGAGQGIALSGDVERLMPVNDLTFSLELPYRAAIYS